MFQYLMARVREARAEEIEGESALEGGFTLIELMVVLLIIAILLAIAIPTFLGVTGSAKDRSAQSQLTNLMTESVATYQNTQSFPTIPAAGAAVCAAATAAACPDAPANYNTIDPQFNWFNGANANNVCTVSGALFGASKCVSVLPVDVATTADLQGVVLAVRSVTGTCWWSVNLQANPAPIAADASAFVSNGGAATAGTFYANNANAMKANPATAPACTADSALTANSNKGLNWGTSYSDSAGNN